MVYTAGYFGIDDSGSIKIVHRFASDMGRPQWSDPRAANYTTVEASNGAVLDLRSEAQYPAVGQDPDDPGHARLSTRERHDHRAVGDPRQDSPGMRVQTFVEPSFEFRTQVDAFATCDYVELPVQPTISIVARPPATWKAVLPAPRRASDRFRLGFKGEDKWGNPSDQVEALFSLRVNHPIRGLPASFSMRRGEQAKSIEGLSGQSEETIGTNSAREPIEFARTAPSRRNEPTPAHPQFRTFLASAYAIEGDPERAAVELAEARMRAGDDRYSTIARLRVAETLGVRKIQALVETTYLAGLRKAGMPEE